MKFLVFVFFAQALQALVAAQQTSDSDPLVVFVSEAFSVYTEVTSILSSVVSAASEAAATSSTIEASTTPSSTSTNPSDTEEAPTVSSPAASRSSGLSLSTTADPSTLSPAHLATSSVVGATAETGSATASSSGSKHESKLPIILGCVLGALVLGLLILTLLICCKRRRRGAAPRHRALSPEEDEVDSWRLTRHSDLTESRHTSRHSLGAPGSAPLMADHPAFRNYPEQGNPFAPVPPPPRRTAPNSRAGLTDGMVPGDEAFLNEKETRRRSRSRSRSGGLATHDGPHKGAALAALPVAAAAGAGLVHKHNDEKKEGRELVGEETPRYEPDMRPRIQRKPVPVNDANNSEPWPYSPVSPIDTNIEPDPPAGISSRSSADSGRSFGRDAARANASFDRQYAPDNSGLEHEPDHNHRLATGAAGVAVGAIGGAVLADRHNRRRSRSTSTGPSHPHSQSPQRPALPTNGEEHDRRPSPGTSRPQSIFGDAVAAQPPAHAERSAPATVSPSPLYSPLEPGGPEIPPVPATRSRRNSALGTAAPAAAVYSYTNRPPNPSPLSSEMRPGRSYDPLPTAGMLDTSRGSGSPHRRRRSTSRYSYSYDNDNNNDDTNYDAYPPIPVQGAEYYPDDGTLSHSALANGIVGDNGYPHMGISRRRSGGDYDFQDAGLQTGPAPPLPTARSGVSASDDSSWRMSSDMPLGWQRERDWESERQREMAMDGSESPRTSGAYARDSGVGGLGATGKGRSKRFRASDVAMRDDVHLYHPGGDGVGQAY